MRRRISNSRLKFNSASSSVVSMAQCVVLTSLELTEFKLQTRGDARKSINCSKVIHWWQWNSSLQADSWVLPCYCTAYISSHTGTRM